VPSYSSSLAGTHKVASSGVGRRGGRKGGLGDLVKFWAYKGHDYRLWMETAWFLAINAITGYVFLYRGFSWPQEPGLVQRFMW
jgi:alpha-1,2-glucosyltransferase